MSLAVLVNLHARRGSEATGQLVRRLFPQARLALTRSQEEARAWIHDHLRPDPPSLLLAGGGDGTITGLLNELRAQGVKVPALGVLPLGTGNAWARVTGAPKPEAALQQLAAYGADRSPPLRTFGLVRVDGRLAPFSGTGWDAEMVSDFHAQKAKIPPGPRREAYAGLRGYVGAMLTRTVPRHLFGEGNANVRVYNLGEDALTVDRQGRIVPLPGKGRGSLLYDGPVGVCGAATTTDFGFGFKAFPFADRVPDRLNVRVYAAGVLEATVNAVRLFKGHHPMPKMYDWFVHKVRMEFDREVPFQIAGDLLGSRREVEFEIASEHVQLLDWRRLSTLVQA